MQSYTLCHDFTRYPRRLRLPAVTLIHFAEPSNARRYPTGACRVRRNTFFSQLTLSARRHLMSKPREAASRMVPGSEMRACRADGSQGAMPALLPPKHIAIGRRVPARIRRDAEGARWRGRQKGKRCNGQERAGNIGQGRMDSPPAQDERHHADIPTRPHAIPSGPEKTRANCALPKIENVSFGTTTIEVSELQPLKNGLY